MVMINDVMGRVWSKNDGNHMPVQQLGTSLSECSFQRCRFSATSRIPSVSWVGLRMAMGNGRSPSVAILKLSFQDSSFMRWAKRIAECGRCRQKGRPGGPGSSGENLTLGARV